MSGEEQTCGRADDAVAFALHALEPHEEAALREHLALCGSCRATVADTEITATALAMAVEQAGPPPALRERILDQAARTPQVRPGAAPVAPSPAPGDSGRAPQGGGRGPAAGPGRSPSGRDGHRRPGAGGSGPGRRTRRLLVAALALVAAVGVGGLGTYTVQLQQQRDAQAAQSQALADMLAELGRPGTAHAMLNTSAGDPVGAVVAAPSARMLMTAGLAENDHDSSIYVLWGVSADAAPQPVGTFDVAAASGPAVHQLEPVAQGRSFIGYAVSLEPGRAAPTEPTTVVASGEVRA